MRIHFLAASALLACIGCGSKIGDSCQTNIDCSPFGDRFCDVSSVNGYCTIESCDLDQNPCPSEGVCIRFFTPIADEPCTYDLANARSDCQRIDERCVCDISVDGQCQNDAGHCAPDSSERRWCERSCSSNGDCRSGYECRSTGTFGSEPLPTFDMSPGAPARFCAPTGASS